MNDGDAPETPSPHGAGSALQARGAVVFALTLRRNVDPSQEEAEGRFRTMSETRQRVENRTTLRDHGDPPGGRRTGREDSRSVPQVEAVHVPEFLASWS